MASLHVFILLSLTGTICGLNPQDPAARVIREVSDAGVLHSVAGAVSSRAGAAVSADEGDVGDMIETANANLGRSRAGPHIMFGDIAVSNSRNAHPCTRTGCRWPGHSNGKVYIPVYISRGYSRAERSDIINGLVSFHRSTCIRFYWRRSQSSFLYFYSGTGCWSYVGRQGGFQRVSLKSRGCLSRGTIQHEVLHALGFSHEQNRSDRDKHVTIVTRNIQKGKEHNFRKVATNNLYTPYDYNSVMHYGRYSFSKQRGRLATIVPKPNPNVRIGAARQMSRNDIDRVNRLYCR